MMRVLHGAALGLLLSSSCSTIPVRATTAPIELPMERLAGRWHVVATTFPMWRNRCDVSFTYGPLSVQTMSDRVGFTEGTEQHVLPGIDTQHPVVPTHFTWRGEGLLSLFASEWDVVAVGPQDAWVVLTFGATLATPAGADIIARSPRLDDETLRQIVTAASTDEVTASRLKGLFAVAPCP
ncbi:MAG: hypothetical protein GQE15_02615 [Archangiaceae bacterium]|nr:hypothetical protein [Archangiaceae bacterium]